MHPTFKHVPPNVARFSTHVTFIPSCAALMAPTYPPGPPPIITTSCCSPVPDEYDLADENEDKLRDNGIEFVVVAELVVAVPNNHRDAELVVVVVAELVVVVKIIFALLLIPLIIIVLSLVFFLFLFFSFQKQKETQRSLSKKTTR
jgi:hypothetical protein